MTRSNRLQIASLLAVFPAIFVACSSPEKSDSAENPEEAFVQSVRGNAGTVTTVASNSPAVDPAAMAKIELQTDKYDMGLIENDRIAVQHTKIFNRGDAPLKIARVTTSCGCTTGEMESTLVAPGGESDLIIRVDPAKIPGFFAEKVLTLHTNDPTNPAPTVHVVSHVKPEAEFNPEILDVGRFPLGEEKTIATTLRQIQEPPLEVIGAALGRDLPYIEITSELLPEADWTVPGKREYKIAAHFTPEAPVGLYDEWIWVNTNVVRYRNLPVKLKAEILGPYKVSPRAVAVRGVEPGQPSEGVLLITSDKPLKILEVSNTNSAIKVTHRETDTPNAVAFDLDVPARTPSRALRDTWTIAVEVDGVRHEETVSVTAILTNTN